MPSWIVARSAAGLLGQTARRAGLAVALIAELADATATDRHERDLGRHEHPVDAR